MLCLRCGKREQFRDSLCERCILETVKAVRINPVLQGSVCPSCNRIQRGKSWDECPGDLSDAACRIAFSSIMVQNGTENPRTELSVDHSDNTLFRISGQSVSNYKGLVLKENITTEVRINLTQCPFCSRQSGNYFEAIIQLRGLEGLSDSEIEDLLDQVRDSTKKMSYKDPNVFITKEEKVRGGFDFYMGENSFAKQLSMKLHDQYGGEYKWSSSLFGRKEGRDVYRHTYLVRLPGFLVGDYLIREGEPLKVVKMSKKVFIRSLKTGRDETIDQSTAMTMRKMKKADAEVDLIVVSSQGDEVQVMHPTSMRTVDMLLGGRKASGETIKGALIEGDLYLV
jgi:nonsense-mediated mRNA decay protein 3